MWWSGRGLGAHGSCGPTFSTERSGVSRLKTQRRGGWSARISAALSLCPGKGHRLLHARLVDNIGIRYRVTIFSRDS